jgi:bifunctional enzyme CysN/CysC
MDLTKPIVCENPANNHEEYLTGAVDREARARLKSQRPVCLWLTGLSGAGKSTLAELIEQRLYALGYHSYVLDGDRLRSGLCADLGFSDAARIEQARRTRETARLMVDAGLIVIVATISPFRSERLKTRHAFLPGAFLEIYIDTPLSICEARDAKGLYRKARAGQISDFTGISSPYEPPSDPELTIYGGREHPGVSADRVLNEMRKLQIIL